MRGTRLAPFLVLLLSFMMACGKSASPTAPSVASPAGAVINGSIVGSLPIGIASLSSSSITVNVVGTTITVTIDSSGRFTLTGVPAGNVQLHFKGATVDATATLMSVQSTDSITITVTLTATTATIDTDDRGNNQGNSQDQLEGVITAIPPTTPAGSFTVDGRTVQTNSSTTFDEGGTPKTFADLKVGTRVHVAGNDTSGGGFLATRVEIQAPEPQETTVTGAIKSITGTAPNLTLVVGTTTVHTNSNTQIGNGDGTDSLRTSDDGSSANFSLLVVGEMVKVEGTTQTDGSVLAQHISFVTTEVTGLITSVTGTAPTLTLMVGTTTVHTTATTQISSADGTDSLVRQLRDDSGGSGANFSLLTVGVDVKVDGISQADGSIIAQQIALVTTQVEGTIATITGSCPTLTFTVGSTKVVTSTSTTFGEVSCTSLKVGSNVQVTGFKQADGSIKATRVSGDDN